MSRSIVGTRYSVLLQVQKMKLYIYRLPLIYPMSMYLNRSNDFIINGPDVEFRPTVTGGLVSIQNVIFNQQRCHELGQ